MRRSIMLFWAVILIVAMACSGAKDSQANGNGYAVSVDVHSLGDTRSREIDSMTEIYIPAGEFLMGASADDTQACDDERPQHSVTLDAYWIDQHEVTNAQYTLCVAAGECTEPWNKVSFTRSSYYGDPQYAEYPVIYVDWYQASAYCAWAGGSLPTEAQWEKGARGTDGKMYPWGDGETRTRLLHYGTSIGDTTIVCSYPDGNSPYGLCDMAGNVWEWVNDWYDAEYYSSSPDSNPRGPATGDTRGLRGSSWIGSIILRSSVRAWNYPDYGFLNSGFRCARQP